MLMIGLPELLILGGLCAVFVLPLVALVVWAFVRGRPKDGGKAVGS